MHELEKSYKLWPLRPHKNCTLSSSYYNVVWLTYVNTHKIKYIVKKLKSVNCNQAPKVVYYEINHWIIIITTYTSDENRYDLTGIWNTRIVHGTFTLLIRSYNITWLWWLHCSTQHKTSVIFHSQREFRTEREREINTKKIFSFLVFCDHFV